MRLTPLLLVPLAVLLSVFLLAPQAAPVVLAQPAGWVELVGERTRTGKSYFDPSRPGARMLEVSVAKIHYDGPDWKDIDNTLVPSLANVPTLGLVDMEMVTDDYEFYALQTLNTIPLWFYRNKSVPEIYITLMPQGLGWTNDLNDVDLISMPQSVAGVVTENRLHWEDAYGTGRSLTLSAQPGRLAKALTLEAIPRAPAQYILDGGNPALELEFVLGTPSGPNAPDIRVDGVLWDQSSRVETVNAVEFEAGGETIFYFAPPSVFDSGLGETAPEFVFRKQGPNLRVAIRVPLAFLETATYPVVIDPTVEEQVEASGDDGYTTEAGGFNSGGANTLTGNVAGVYNAFGRWPDVSVPPDALVTAAWVGWYAVDFGNDGGATASNVYFEAADDPAAPTTEADYESRVRSTLFAVYDGADAVDTTTQMNITGLAPALGEITNRSGWSENNAVLMLWDDDSSPNGKRYSQQAWDGDASEAFILHVEYTGGWTNTAPSIDSPITTETSTVDVAYSRSFTATDPDTNQTLQWELNTTDAPFTITVDSQNRTAWINATPDEEGVFYANVSVYDAATVGNASDFMNFTWTVIESSVTFWTSTSGITFIIGLIGIVVLIVLAILIHPLILIGAGAGGLFLANVVYEGTQSAGISMMFVFIGIALIIGGAFGMKAKRGL